MTLKKYFAAVLPYIALIAATATAFSVAAALEEVNPAIIILALIGLLSAALAFFVCDYFVRRTHYKKLERIFAAAADKCAVPDCAKISLSAEQQLYMDILEKACAHMTAKIAEAETERREFGEYVERWVHEIKTPLTALSLYLDNKTADERVKCELNKLNALTEQVLFYSRSDSVDRDYVITRVELGEAVHEVIMDNKSLLLSSKAEIKTENLGTIFTDKRWLKFMLGQLLINSVKYSKAGGVTVTISGGENSVTVTDDGIGIPQADLPRIFDKGFTGSDRGKERSTGMGLYIVKKLCGKLNAAVSARSEEGKYTSVTLTFPICDFNLV